MSRDPGRTAFVLAAGRGERMRPLTAGRAKPTLPVLGRSMFERIVALLAQQGVSRFVANAHHCPESVREAAAAAAATARLPAAAIEVVEEPILMGSAGSMAAPAERLAEAGRFLLYNGDTLMTPPVEALFAAAEGERRIGSLLVRPGRTTGYGGLTLRDGLVVSRFQPGEDPGPGEPATYLGVAVVGREVLERVPRDRPSELFRDVVLPLLRDGLTLAAVPHAGPWLEFTGPRSYLRTLVRLLHAGRAAGRAAVPGGDAPLRRSPDGVIYAADGAVVESGAIVEGAVVLERGARLCRGARVTNAVLLEGAAAEWGTLLQDVVVDRGVRVARGATIQGGVVTATPCGEPRGSHVVQPFAS